MPPTDESTPFASAERFYAEYRPGYGEDAVGYLVERFGLDDGARVLDLGCGAGQLALPLAEHAGEVVGMDPNSAMLRYARERATAAARENVTWVQGSDEDLDGSQGTFRLVTMGRSFHWMDGAATLDRIHAVTESGGGVAILNDAEWLTRGEEDWQEAVYRVAEEYVEDLPPRRTAGEEDDPWDELVASRGFADVEVRHFEQRRTWDVDDVVGYVLSLSFCSPATLGNRREAFESALRTRLDELEGAPFEQAAGVEVIAGRK